MSGKRSKLQTDLNSLSFPDNFPPAASLAAALKQPLPDSTYASIVLSTGLYLALAQAQRDATPDRDLAKKLKRLNESGHSVRSELTKSKFNKLPSWTLTPRNTFKAEEEAYGALKLIMSRLPKHIPPAIEAIGAPADFPKVRPPFDLVRREIFRQLLDATLTISLWIEDEYKIAAAQRQMKANAWGYWIAFLTAIMRRDRLPYQVSKATTNPNASISPFVKFVRALQANLPTDFQRHMHSDDALRQAIVRARKGNTFESNNVDEIFDFLLSSRKRRRARPVFIG